MADLRKRRDALRGVDLVELRLDTVSDPDPSAALAGRRMPAIITCRASWEGGGFKGSEEERHRILAQALALGAEYVDVEWKAEFADLIGSAPDRIIVSFHDFTGVPADLENRVRSMLGTGAAVVKAAVTPLRLGDLSALEQAGGSAGDGHHVLIGMGERGLLTRVLPERFGSIWTYAGDLAGVGQVAVGTLLEMYRFREIDSAADLYGVVGSPITHSVSPAVHNASFRALGLDAVYLPLPAADVDDLLAFADALGLQGASVTIPFKVPLLERIAELDESARLTGAVNTIRRRGGSWQGTNTDVEGFLRPLDRRGTILDGLRVSVLGAGGSARAVAVGLRERGARVTIHARRQQAAESVAAVASADVGPWPPSPGSWDLLVNCTPVGMHPDVTQSPLPDGPFDGRAVYDLIYNPQETRLLRDAKTAGCAIIGGLDMLVAQAEGQCRWWTGREPPAGIMKAAALRRLSEFSDEHHVV
jgi:3-dehydroquinate dehydratase/shikimate dehydrogenase